MDNQTLNTQNTDPNLWPGDLQIQKKNQKKKIVYIVLAVLLVIGSAWGSFYLSKNLNQASVPTAPESEPQAAGTGCPNDHTCGKNEYCDFKNGFGRCRPVAPTPTGFGENYTCTTTNCPAPCFTCNASKTSCISLGCVGVSDVGKPSISIAGAPKITPPNLDMCEDLKEATGCPIEECHCTGGDACTTVECGIDYERGTNLRTSCSNQGRSWCVNMTGNGMTCCQAGYVCHPSGKGCIATSVKPTRTTMQTTTTATIPPTNTATIPPTATVPPTNTATITVTITPTIVDCNESCVVDSDCSTGLICDSESDRCRKATCTTSSTCVCPTTTPEPTIADCNARCNSDDNCSSGLICDSDSGRCRKAACSDEKDCSCPTARSTDAPEEQITRTATRRAAQPTVLTEAGILDFPGAAVFGSGLLLTIIGILLAL